MNYEEEIRYRNELLAKARSDHKITSEDRLWLATHRIYNQFLGYPYLNTDIVHLLPKVNYHIRVKVESRTHSGRILPVITVPGGKGTITANTLLIDYNGNAVSKKNVKMLGLLLDLNYNETQFDYKSDLGLLEVSFECEYYDDKQHLTIRKNSDVGDPYFAMLCEVLSDNKVLYRCKAPDDNAFESLVFSVQWETATKK